MPKFAKSSAWPYNADAILAGPVTSPGVTHAVCAGTAITCGSTTASCTTAADAADDRETCLGSLVVTGQSGAVLSGGSVRPGMTVTGATAVYLHHFTVAGAVGKFGGALYLVGRCRLHR
jgi:hypothetical protein